MEYQINNKRYRLIDSLERISSKDSFTDTSNKIGNGAGAWEWHIGSKNDALWYDFFGGKNFNVRCFLSKKDLIWLMYQMKGEYYNPTYDYRGKNNFHQIWCTRLQEVQALPDYAFFDFREHDGRNPEDLRLYAKRPGQDAEGDNVYGMIRKLALPETTFTSILRLRADDGEELYYFKIFPELFRSVTYNEEITEIVEQINNTLEIEETERKQLIISRIGQGMFRSNLINECGYCPITLIDDSRLLIASHIKPWRVSNNVERLNEKNGILLTPTFDKLFDNGFISFRDDKTLLVSPWISNNNIERLRIAPNMEIPNLPIEGREAFLEYHRLMIFKQ